MRHTNPNTRLYRLSALSAAIVILAACGSGPGHDKLVRDSEDALKAERVDDAQILAERALQESPESRRAREVLAEALREKAHRAESRGELEAALAHRKRAAQTEPSRLKKAQDFAQVAVDARDLGEFETATNAIKAAVRANPSDVGIRRYAAQWADEDGDAQLAVHHFLWLYEADPTDVPTGLRLATLYLSSGRARDAEAIYGRVLTVDPANVQAALGRADALESLKKLDRAESIYERLIRDHPKNGGLYFRYAEFLERRGENRSAKRWRKKGEKILPGVKRRRMRRLRSRK